jgi:hypothetical protein
MAAWGLTWISDRDPGMRRFFADAVPTGEVMAPDELLVRLRAGMRPDALIIDGTQFLELPMRAHRAVMGLARVLVCTGLSLVGLPAELHRRPNVVVLGKPFCVEDLEAALEWLTDAPVRLDPAGHARRPIPIGGAETDAPGLPQGQPPTTRSTAR